MRQYINGLAISAIAAGSLMWVSVAVCDSEGIGIEIGYDVHQTGSGYVDFDIQARNATHRIAYDVVVEAQGGVYPPIHFGDIASGETAVQLLHLTYEGEPPVLNWTVSYMDEQGKFTSAEVDSLSRR